MHSFFVSEQPIQKTKKEIFQKKCKEATGKLYIYYPGPGTYIATS